MNILGRPNRGLEASGSELNLLLYIHHVYAYFDSDSLTEESQCFLEDLYQTSSRPRRLRTWHTKVIAITIARSHGRVQNSRKQPLAYYTNELADSDSACTEVGLPYRDDLPPLPLSQYEQGLYQFSLHIQYIDGVALSSQSE